MTNKGGRPFGAKDKVVRDLEGAAKRCGQASLSALADVVENKEASDLARVLAAQTLLGLGYGASFTDRVPADAIADEVRCGDG
ncbi:MAG: hypothetical protein RIC87_12585 [Kiloniellales bacterium]